MYLTRCKKCEASVEIVDEYVAAVDCPSCGYTIKLRESEADKRKRREKAHREAEKRKPKPPNPWLERLPILICVPLSLFALFVTCLAPPLVIAAVLVGVIVSIVGFTKGCMVASHDGNYIAFDYLGIMEYFISPIAIGGAVVLCGFALLFWMTYTAGYLILWQIALITCTIRNPKVYLPWLGLQAYGCLVVLLSGVCWMIGEAIWAAFR